jgi:hypothetical protein
MTRKLVLQMAVSLDGFVSRADNSLDWGRPARTRSTTT